MEYGLLLVAGCQTHQENYARSFAADSRCRLIGLTDEPNISSRRRALNLKLASELKIPYFDDFSTAVSRDDVDIACVCVEPERRGRVAAACARAGKHVYIDKPMTTSVADAHKVLAAVKESGVQSQMFSLVRTPVSLRARRVLEMGRIGQLVGLHCELLFAKGRAGTADLSQPRHESPQAERFTFIDSKRELFCVGVYPLVLFQWLTGSKVKNVYGTTSNYFFAEHQKNDVEDFSFLLMQLENEVDATISVGRTGWSSHPGFGIHQIHLIGTDGVATVDAFRPRLEIYSDATAWKPPEIPHPEDPMGFWSSTQTENDILPKTDWWPITLALQSDMSYFLDCIEAGRASDVSAEVGAHAAEVILAGYQSAANEAVVELPMKA